MLFRIISFSKACTIHPGTLGPICDTKAYESIYEEIKREEDLDNPLQPGDSSSSGLHIDTKVEDVAPDIVPASPSYSESLGASHGTESIRKVIERRWADAPSEQAETEDQAQDDFPDEEEPFDSDAEARKKEKIIQRRLDKLTDVAGTIMSNLQQTARDHIMMCRGDYQFRSANSDPNAPKGTGPIVLHMNETFGPDHKALEGFDEHEKSLKAALIDEMTSLLKKADLAKDTPIPSILQKEKEKDRKLEVARLASAARGSGQGAPGATAKPKPRPRSKSPNFPGFSGNRAEMENEVIAQAKIYTAAAKKIVPTSSNCDDLGRAVMSHRQANDQRRPMKLACFDSDRIRKIDFDREGKGDAYTEIGDTYGHVLARLADAGISPIFPINKEWLPEGAGAWFIIDGDASKDNPDDIYPNQPFMYDNRDQTFRKKASMELNAALRHPSREPPHFMLKLHEDGWASTLDCIRHLRLKVVKFTGISRGTVDRICSYNWLLRVTLCDLKHRYQLAGATDTYGILKGGSNIISFGFIRAKGGHSGTVAELVDDKSAYSWISPNFASSISCLCHKTQRQYVRDIFYKGLMPGEMIHSGGRRHVDLSPFLPHDPRNTAVGRQHDSYDTIIVFKKDRVLSEHEMLLSANGIFATTEVLNSDLIQLICVVPSGQFNKRWVLYDPDLRDLVPCGYTAMEMSRSYYKDVLWEHERRVANDSYACPNQP